ncbi:MAG: cupin domain-containing protein [Chloroflexi bacterium]|nr:cupin domain-containing protein [Chloroflexota bacterium]
MPYAIFDYRHDIKNLFVTPRIRSRFLRMEPGEVHRRHSHDLGHEIFLILEGQCDMDIDGERAVLGPGQVCVAFAHQMHQARNTGDTPMTMYLSVTPHVEPTHTMYDPDTGERLPPRYNLPSHFDLEDATAGLSTTALADRFATAYRALAATVQAAADSQETAITALINAADRDDFDGLARAMDSLWEGVRATHDQLDAMTAAWNALAPRAAGRL